jgi:hypothetical protein
MPSQRHKLHHDGSRDTAPAVTIAHGDDHEGGHRHGWAFDRLRGEPHAVRFVRRRPGKRDARLSVAFVTAGLPAMIAVDTAVFLAHSVDGLPAVTLENPHRMQKFRQALTR